ncbi:hypothetical protein DCC62_27740 [candidate division KSB1 bacterium]|nr:MAG: hypothetical protein DCC62_27740 [candidate division KSB1 bacterium]
MRRIFTCLSIFLPLVIYDVLFGGAIAALLQSEGWQGAAQRINNVYQLSYGVVVVSVLVLAFFKFDKRREALAVLILFIGLVEDSLFYLLIKFLNPLIQILTQGAAYRAPESILPEGVASWPGWVSRMFWESFWRMRPSIILFIPLKLKSSQSSP